MKKIMYGMLLAGLFANAVQAATAPVAEVEAGRRSSKALCCCIGIVLSLGGVTSVLRFVHDNPARALVMVRETVRNNTGIEFEEYLADFVISDSVAPDDRAEAVRVLTAGYQSYFNTLLKDPAFPTTDMTAAQALSDILQMGQCPSDLKTVLQQCRAPHRKEKFSGKAPDHAKLGRRVRPGH